MQTDTGISFLHFNADVIPKSDAQKRFEATFDRKFVAALIELIFI